MQDELEERLRNWAWFVNYGTIGPEIRSRCASAEGEYVSEDVWEGEEPKLEPDMIDGQVLENIIRNLPDVSRRVIKARYIQFPYNLSHNVAQSLRMSLSKLESELALAKSRIRIQLKKVVA